MTNWDIFPGWGRILRGYRPFLALEITRECPLRCPGCYAYQPDHVGAGRPLRQMADFRGKELVVRVMALVRRLRPIHISIVGGEPLVRRRELDDLLPELNRLGIEVQLVTSAVRPVPAGWAKLEKVHLVVSIDGLQPEHDRRRFPATYDRILDNIHGHSVIVHCTITRRMLQDRSHLREFALYWSSRGEARKIWFSLYTPQEGEQAEERLSPQDRLGVVEELGRVRNKFPKVQAPPSVCRGYLSPPRSPMECLFAQLTTCISADLDTRILPCQIGGRPECGECGCMASAGVSAIGNYRLAGLLPLSSLVTLSKKIGELAGRRRGG